MLSIAYHFACALIDTGATHICMSEEYLNACGLVPEVLSNVVMFLGTP